jgi:hypothetical protein
MSLRYGRDVDAAIALPAGFVLLLADRVLFAVVDYLELSRWDTDLDKVVLGGVGPLITERDVILFGTASSQWPSMVSYQAKSQEVAILAAIRLVAISPQIV